jgi:hypothetical protein
MSLLFHNQPSTSREAFWQRLENKLGVPILEYALGQYMLGEEVKGPLWGLFYLTEKAFYFQHFAQSNWFLSMMSTGDGDEESGGGRTRDLTVEIALDTIGSVTCPEKRRGLARLIHGEDRVFSLQRDGTGEGPFVFTLETKISEFSARLAALLPTGR